MRVVEENQIRERINLEFENLNGVAVKMSPLLLEKNAQAIYDLCAQAAEQNGGRYLVLDDNSVVVGDSFSTLNGRRVNIAEVNSLLYQNKDTDYGFHITDNENFYSAYLTIALYENNETIGAMLLSASVQDVYEQTKRLTSTIVFLSAATALVVIFVSIITSRYITRPVLVLTQAARNMANGNLNERVEIKGKSEIATLGNAFNIMGERLKNMDAERADFVSNASHELRTPLSSIKILTESLLYQENVPENLYKEFLTDINFEIDRLNNIITDLLDITKLEDVSSVLKLAVVNIGRLTKEVIESLEPLYTGKNIHVKFNEEEKITCVCDELKIRQALSNLIDNAIKYTDNGGKISVNLYKNDEEVIFSVSDTGIGIPESELKKIFDRFYRVDKARSRETGGTGLGLYISKKIVVMHGGYLNVKSEQNVGTTFEMVIPGGRVE